MEMSAKKFFAVPSLFLTLAAAAQSEIPWFLSAADTLGGVHLTEVEFSTSGQAVSPTKKQKNNDTVIVAVIDGGMDIAHPELSDLIWTNAREIADNGKDDDKNGYTDDVHGWNFLGNAAGEDFLKAGTEPFREYKRLRPLFKDVDAGRLSGSRKAEYDYYKQMERAAKLDKYIIFTEFQRQRAEAFRICDSLMRLQYGDQETFIADFQLLEVADTTGLTQALMTVASTPMMFMPEMPWREAVKRVNDEYELSAKRIASLDTQDDDPHIKLGNDPEDFRHLRYGNNHIAPDPYHGTMVAGVIAACVRNVAQLPHPVRIMPVRAIPEGDEYDRDVAAAIRYAVDNGAKVVNMSFGKYVSPHRDQVLKAMEYARRHDVLLVMAAGNDAKNVDSLPIYPDCRNAKGQRLEHLVVVGASTPHKQIASFSNYGAANVDLLAPGEDIRSTAPEGSFDTAQGTSIAAPVVTGVAALLRSCYPDLSAREIREILIRTASGLEAGPCPTTNPNAEPRTVAGKEVCLAGGILNARDAFRLAAEISKRKK